MRPRTSRRRVVLASVCGSLLACGLLCGCGGGCSERKAPASDPQHAEREPEPGGDSKRTSSPQPPTLVRAEPAECGGWPATPPAADRAPAAASWRVLWSREDFRGELGRALSATGDFTAPTIDDVQPAVTAARIYLVAGDRGGIVALSHAGELLWGHNLPSPYGADPNADGDDNGVASPPVATPDGRVLVATRHGELLCYRPRGKLAWKRYVTERRPPGTVAAVGRRIALGPRDRIYWAPVGESTVRAYTRCGDLVWTLRFPARARRRGLYVGADGTLFVLVGSERLYRVRAGGSVKELPLPIDHLRLEAIARDGTLRGQGIASFDGRWRRVMHTALDPGSGAVRDRLSYRFHPRQAAHRFVSALEPFGVLTYGPMLDPDGGWHGLAEWRRPDGAGRHRLEVRDPSFDLAPAGGDKVAIRLRDGGVLGLAHGLDADLGGVVLLRPDGVDRPLDPLAGTHMALHPSGLLVVAGQRSVTAIRTPLRPADGWSHRYANAWSSSSLAVAPPP